MKYVYLSIISSGFVIIGYLPEIYSTITQKKNFPTAQYSSTIWLLAGVFGIIYSSLNDETFITVNYSINTLLNVTILLLKQYYKCKNEIKNEINIATDFASLKNEQHAEVLQM